MNMHVDLKAKVHVWYSVIGQLKIIPAKNNISADA